MPGLAEPELRTIETRYYFVHTDVSETDARETTLRLTKMAEEYHSRTAGFSGEIRTRFPFYLYQNNQDYLAAGGIPGSAGLFNGKELMATVAGKEPGPRTWKIVQHEGFHQFAHLVISGKLPTWVDEGLAEYFGEAVFTGDGYVSGGIPQWRLERIRQTFKDEKFSPIERMMQMPLNEWNSNLSIVNYDQGWSMVQFLAHGDGGKYQKAFATFMNDMSRGKSWQDAWQSAFGSAQGFEQKWRDWWLALPDNPSEDVFAQATASKLAGFLGRAFAQKQSFESFEEFYRIADARQLKAAPTDWLPPTLLEDALNEVDQSRKLGAEWLLNQPAKERPQIVCRLRDGRTITATFTIRSGKVSEVRTSIAPPIKPR